MSKIEPIDLLVLAREKEKRYEWTAAAEIHKKVLCGLSQQGDMFRTGEVAERIGYCFHRAAMQAKSRDEFKRKMKLAIGSYQRAQGFYAALPDQQKEGRELRSKAVVTYLSYWLISKGSEKRKLLDECLELEDRALTSFQNSGNMLEYARTYNILWPVFFFRGCLEWDRKTLLALINKGIERGEKAISTLSELEYPSEVAWAYFTSATCLTYVASRDNHVGLFILEPEEREKDHLQVTISLTKAMALAEKLEDSYLKGLLNLWFAFSLCRGPAFSSNIENALNSGIITQDNFLSGASLDMLAYDSLWQGWGDPAGRWKGTEIGIEFHDKALKHNSIINSQSFDSGPLAEPYGRATYYLYKATFSDITPEKRIDLLNVAENLGIEALKLALDADMPRPVEGALHTLSRVLMERARLDSELEQKRNRLRKAIEYRAKAINMCEKREPFSFFDHGVIRSYLAETKARLAEVESDPNEKKLLLQEAVMDEERSLESCAKMMPYYERISQFDYLPVFGFILDRFSAMMTHIHDLTKPSNDLKRTIEILCTAIKSVRKQDMLSLVAELYWRIAKAQDSMEEHLDAAESFRIASESYLEAANRFPQLRGFYESYACCMQAWNEVEQAKAAHAKEEFCLAKTHYERAAMIHKSTTQWGYLSSNYFAWAQLEAAEKLSRSEKTEEAIEAFLKAIELFEKAGKSIQPKLETPLSIEEKESASSLLEASEKRCEYCLGRIALEEARIQDRKGDHLQSSRKYGLAAKIFERLAGDEGERSRKQLLPIFYLCQAWARMMMAEETASSKAYEEAAEFFNRAKELSLNQKTRLFALANSRFCKALASGTEFEITRDLTAYSNAKKHMEAAENYYLKADQGSASEYAKATLELIDAYMYITKAETETEPEEKAKYYSIAERTLKASLDSYLRAKHPEKTVEVQKLLENIDEKRQLAVSLMRVLPESSITATTSLFAVPTPTHEEPVGFERFAHAELEGNLTISEEVTVEDQVKIKLDIVNVGRQGGLLLRVQGLIPSGFRLTSSSDLKIEGDLIDVKGKRIEPLTVESIQLSLQATETGIFDLKPQISYVDEVGKFKQCIPESATVTVYPKLELKFRSDASGKVFGYLVKSFVEDYMRRKIVLQESGWRSLAQITKNAKVSSRSVYGYRRIPGSAIHELEKRGLIDPRVFLGERGRGGEVVRARICYEKEVVKRLVDHVVAKNE